MSQAMALFLGASLSGLVGASLFFIQRWVQKRDEEKNRLFDIYRRLKAPIGPSTPLGLGAEIPRLRAELEDLALLVKNKKLRKEIYLLVSKSRYMPEGHALVVILQKLKMKLNKGLVEEIRKEEEAAAKPSDR